MMSADQSASVESEVTALQDQYGDLDINSGGVETDSKPQDCQAQVEHLKNQNKINQTHVNVKIVAPTLRVEELRDEDCTFSSSGGSGLSEEEGNSSQGESEKQKKELPPFEPPNDELKNKIIKQVEFYFSDANIVKDVFLLKHIRRHKGFVSLKLISSFKKVKVLTKDYRVVAYSLRDSEHIVLNEEETKLRRKDPLPEYDETTPYRTVIAVNLPYDNPTFDNVAELFSQCGDIALIRILRPGRQIPADVKKHANKHPELGKSVCAVVEFEDHASAKKATETLHSDTNWRSSMRVMMLAIKKNEGKNKKKNAKKNGKKGVENNGASSDAMTGGSDAECDKKVNKRKNSRVKELAAGSYEYSSSSDVEHSDQPSHVSRVRANSAGNLNIRKSLSPNPTSQNRLSPNVSPKSSPRGSPRTSPRSSPRGSPTSRRKQHGRSPLAAGLSPQQSPRSSPRVSPERRHSSDRPASPWVQRRMQLKAQEAEATSSSGISPRHSPIPSRRSNASPITARMANMLGVTRQPKGPDGTRGFHAGNGTISPLVTSDSAKA